MTSPSIQLDAVAVQVEALMKTHQGREALFPCEDCGGTGYTGDVIPASHFQPPEPVGCPTCGGSGRGYKAIAYEESELRAILTADLATQVAEPTHVHLLKEIYGYLKSICPEGIAEEAFRMVPSPLREEIFDSENAAGDAPRKPDGDSRQDTGAGRNGVLGAASPSSTALLAARVAGMEDAALIADSEAKRYYAEVKETSSHALSVDLSGWSQGCTLIATAIRDAAARASLGAQP